jgi:hypothetical protein
MPLINEFRDRRRRFELVAKLQTEKLSSDLQFARLWRIGGQKILAVTIKKISSQLTFM